MRRSRAIRLFIFLLLFNLPIAAYAQQTTPDPEQDAMIDRWLALSESELEKQLEAVKDKLSADLARATNIRGIEAYRRQDYEKALALYRVFRKISEIIGDRSQIANADSNAGMVYFAMNEYAPALGLLYKSLAVNKELGKRSAAASVLNSIALIQRPQGDYALALASYEEALELNEAEENKSGMAQTLFNMGTANNQMGNAELALQQFHKSLQLSEEIGHELGQSYVLAALGSVYHDQRDFLLARDYHEKALKLKRKVGNSSEIALTLSNLALTHAALGNAGAAEDKFREAMALNEKTGDRLAQGRTRIQYGTLLQNTRKLDEAAGQLKEGLALVESVPEKKFVAEALSRLADNSVLRRNYPAAMDYSRRALDLSRETGLLRHTAKAATTMGVTLRALGRDEEAKSAFTEAIAASESLRDQMSPAPEERLLFFEDKVDPYHQMMELMLARHDTAEALGFAERARARALLDMLQAERADVSKDMTAEERRKEKRLRDALSEANLRLRREREKAQPDPSRVAILVERVDEARIAYQQFRNVLYATHPRLREFRGDLKPVTLADAAALLPDSRAAFLEYVVSDQNVYLFTIVESGSSARAASHKLKIDPSELAKKVQNLRDAIATRNPEFRDQATSLYEALLTPAAAELSGKTTLVIIPDGVLWDMPFQLLLSGSDRYLLEDFALSYAPSLAALREMSRGRQGTRAGAPTLLAFGNPVGANLPNSQREVLALRELYGPDRSRVYTGADAVEAKLKTEAAAFQVLHVATHGTFDGRKPLYSNLVMSPGRAGSGDDGLLEAREMMDLHLKADLVVLSACETGRGQSDGEGLIGMSWALFVAGAPTAVTSHWKVDSASTTDLMIDFHRTLKASKTSATAALRQAALRILRRPEYRHPFYWAGFSVVGYGF